MEWISVKDRLPEEDPNIKKHIEGEKFGFLVVKQTNGWEWAPSNVTDWTLLPEPPKEAAE